MKRTGKKVIVYHDGDKVTGVESVGATALEAMRFGHVGADVETYKRAIKALGAETIATLMKTTPQLSENEALANHARDKHPDRSWLIVADTDLPTGEQEEWRVVKGAVKAAT